MPTPMGLTAEHAQSPCVVSKPPRNWIRWSAVVLAAAGWWMSLDLLRLGLGGEASNPWLEARCGTASPAGKTFDCRSVLASKWASVPREPAPNTTPMPVATFGMAYFAFLGLWYLLLGCPTRKRWGWHLLLAVVVGAGVLQSLEMIHVMAYVLHKWCAGCLVVHAINGALALLTLIAFPWRRDREGVAPHPQSRAALATLTAAFLLFLSHPAVVRILMSTSAARQALQAYRKIVDDPEFVRWQYQRQPVVSIPNDPQRTCLGDPNAPNTVVAFIEMQCPACMAAGDVLAEILRIHPAALRVDFRHFPLDSASNEGWPQGECPASCRASLAAEAARVIGGAPGFQQMRALLHERRHELQTAPYVQWAAELGLEPAAFSDAMASDQVASRVRADIVLGKQLGVEAVPVLFLNGRRLDHWSKAETWETLLGLESPAPTSASTAP
jgi:protein-disulfide isomerase/uncharacterized membrane protein